MNSKRNAPTMKDVAAEAGVALGTVSKVFNQIPVGEEYRLRVEAAAGRLGYQVNNYARGLKTNRTMTVALILPSLDHPFFGQLANEAIRALWTRGYRALVAVSNADPKGELKCIDMVRQNKVDGIIALTYNPELVVDETLPFVSIDRFFGSSIPCVSSDNFGGGQLAAHKLIELGCRRLVFMSSDAHVTGEVDKRGVGFEMACRQLGVPVDCLSPHESLGLEPLHAYIDAHILDGKPDFDGLFCNTDTLALLMCRYLRGKGIRVPEDVQVIGFDGIRNFATGEYFCSTIVQPIAQMAETAVDCLLSRDQSRLQALISLPVFYKAGGTTRD